jgi:fructokinase
VGGLLFHMTRDDRLRAGFASFVSDTDAVTAAIRFAAAVGALAVTRKGAFAAMPSVEEVDALLA